MSARIRSDGEERIARLRGTTLPAITTMLGSATVILPIIASTPLLPPFGLLMLLAWRLLRPELWPVWIGLPLGLIDDLFSGQPIGSAMLLWTLALLGIDLADRRMVWRDYWQDWLIAAAAIILCLIGGLVTANATGGNGTVQQIVPQMVLSVLIFPAVVRLCALLDRWRLS
ncbi:rod shape-determining protein MreD [Sphingomonas sp. LaA6.9]|uniref:rod shape-determining protein MreD n=1 Tax=Sphingomonas sp. LaA6.9 TaxID=2919914 RepID=UPI001F4FA65E|nr:rod shape-determining protein MreD [Sphingomonas sp. LaA6.9]MCJ8157814.1 rod shape-determining protein MreD [Sphingomonas sp. LaA6.9]